MLEFWNNSGLHMVLLLTVAIVIFGVYRMALRQDVFTLHAPNPLHAWRTQKLIQRITVLVLLIGERTDGPLKGRIPSWLAGFNHAERGQGTFDVLVSFQEEYFIVTFKVNGWTPSYSSVEVYSTENAHKLMKAHLEALGRWQPLKTVD